jgi:hypothetical protein
MTADLHATRIAILAGSTDARTEMERAIESPDEDERE